ncbi:hypothetical protein HanIR_Chr03g0111101 [Helianthus annuus]|nr:hypothetical protein HanIR_Chr03g0111101 [Helianthus annuus]
MFGPWPFCAPFRIYVIIYMFSCKLKDQTSILNLLNFHFKFCALWVEFWGFGDQHGYSQN